MNLESVFGKRALWVNSVRVTGSRAFVLAVIVYALVQSDDEKTFVAKVKELIDAYSRVQNRTLSGVWGLPDDFFVFRALVRVLSDEISKDAPLSSLQYVRIGKNYLETYYPGEFGKTEMGKVSGDRQVVFKIDGAYLRHVLKQN